jgi:hypothetical protein
VKKALPALLLLLTFAGCAHRQGAYGGGGGGYFAEDCVYSYGCYDGIYGRGFDYYDYAVSPQSPARTRVTKVERRTSTRVVHRSAATPSAVSRSAPARLSAHAGSAHSAHSAPPSHAGGRR